MSFAVEYGILTVRVLPINGKRRVFPWLIPGRKALLWALRSIEKGGLAYGYIL